ncbi:copper resistance system multicopper oxidase [Salinibacter sp.]|uniref:copper resistance system multicopper oxidase n=1 Tax=Salinibacter sp. TaxID=2065818 RepID=UPI0021E6DDE5|nr:copper resistance system multicopper oxidase [Salinibacter sp.]
MSQSNPNENLNLETPPIGRRDFVKSAGALTALAGLQTLLPGWAQASPGRPAQAGLQALEPTRRVGNRVEYDLEIARKAFEVGGRETEAIALNGTVPGPLIRLQEGEEVVLRYHNTLGETSSIHWHGLLIPNQYDGVPAVNYPGVPPGETFEAGPFEVRQYGTYWYHSHSGVQEQLGQLGPLLIDPAGETPFDYDRELVVVLSDWTFQDPNQIFANLKKGEEYYNFQKRTVGEFWSDVSEEGFFSTLKDRLSWKRMRMSPTDLQSVRGHTYTYLMNGQAPTDNWTGLFEPGERVRLRFINASFATIFDVRVPGLEMEVVQASGQNVEPVTTDEFRIGTAERYDVIVEPTEDRAYTVFAESLSRSGHARGTIAPEEGMEAPVPEERERPKLTMADMGMMHGDGGEMDGMEGMAMGGAAGSAASPDSEGGDMDHGNMDHGESGSMAGGAAGSMSSDGASALRPPGTLPEPVKHDPDDDHGPAEAGVPMMTRSRLHEPGVGLGDDGRRVLTYDQLKARDEKDSFEAPDREIELHLTGNMERFIWSIDGTKFSDTGPVRINRGERTRLVIVNDTMMNHPMHLHGMFMELENGHGERAPLLDTILVKPAERVSLLIDGDEPGPWFFHCHIIWHMKAGMARVFYVEPPEEQKGDFYYELPA